MADEPHSNLYDFTVSGRLRTIAFENTYHVADGVDADIYTFLDDHTHLLTVFTVAAGMKIPSHKVTGGQRIIEGYVKGKGTLTVSSASGAKETYYFEHDGHTKDVIVESGQSVQWITPNDSELVYYEVIPMPRPAHPRSVAPAPKPTGPRLKLLLSSTTLSSTQAQALAKLAGKPIHSIKIALIENAADITSEPRYWQTINHQSLDQHGFAVQRIDLRRYMRAHVGLLELLQHQDVIWLGGGNVFFLRWILRNSRADEMIVRLVHKGLIYGGANAGAVVAGSTLKYLENIYDPGDIPLVTDGLRFIDTMVLTSVGNQKLKEDLKELYIKLRTHHLTTLELKDGQALLTDGSGSQEILT